MANTITLQDTIYWAQSYAQYIELNIGTNNEPAFSNANTILQTILGAPFRWNWNRASTTITTIAGTQDYSTSLATFGFIEGASAAGATGPAFEMTVKDYLSVGNANEQSRPEFIAAQLDDNAGNITFRVFPTPDAVYTITPFFQKRAPALFSSLSGTWAPIPDHYSYIYNYGFLALTLAYSDDPRWEQFNQKFIGGLLGAQQGLSDLQRNIFLGNWLYTMQQVSSRNLATSQGTQARGV